MTEKHYTTQPTNPKKKLLYFDYGTAKELKRRETEKYISIDYEQKVYALYTDKTKELNHYLKYTQKCNKFLCVGGPLGGQKKVEKDAPEYRVYNCSVRQNRMKGENSPSSILVFKGDLK